MFYIYIYIAYINNLLLRTLKSHWPLENEWLPGQFVVVSVNGALDLIALALEHRTNVILFRSYRRLWTLLFPHGTV